jgi:hypothetical protein
MLIAALPLTSVVAAEVYPPPLSTTDPVGVELPAVPATATVTVKACAEVMLVGAGVTVTVGVALFTTSVTTFEVLPLKFASPPYTAVMLCEAPVSALVV